MSSDPSAPIISEILPDEPHTTKHDVVNDNEVYYELEPTDPESKPQIEKLKRSVSRQDTTLRKIQKFAQSPNFQGHSKKFIF